MKVRKILQLKQLSIQRAQIIDIIKVMENSNLLDEYKRDLKGRKIKFIDTFYKYYNSQSWEWMCHKKNKEVKVQSNFVPVYRESQKMIKLMTSFEEKEELTHNPSRRVQTFQDNDSALLSARSLSSVPDDRYSLISKEPVPEYKVQYPQVVPHQHKSQSRRIDMLKTSEDNPLSDTLTHGFIQNLTQKPTERVKILEYRKNVKPINIPPTSSRRNYSSFIHVNQNQNAGRENYNEANRQNMMKSIQPTQKRQNVRKRPIWKKKIKK